MDEAKRRLLGCAVSTRDTLIPPVYICICPVHMSFGVHDGVGEFDGGGWWGPLLGCSVPVLNGGELSLAGLLDGLHPAIFVAVAANHLGTNGGQGGIDLLQGLGAEKRHLLLKEQCDGGTDEN